MHGEQEMIAKVAKYAKLVNFKSWHPQVVSLVAVYQKTEYTSHSMSKYICQEYTNGAWMIENERFCDLYLKEAAGGDGVHGRGGTIWSDIHQGLEFSLLLEYIRWIVWQLPATPKKNVYGQAIYAYRSLDLAPD